MILTVDLFQRKVVGFIPLDVSCSLMSCGIFSLAPLFEGFLEGREFHACLRLE